MSKFGRSLGSRGHNPSIDPYNFYPEDMPIVLLNFAHYFVDYCKVFDMLKRAICIIVVFTFSYFHFSKIDVHKLTNTQSQK